MDQVKIDNFIRERSGRTFPEYIVLSNEECADIRSTLIKKLGLDPSTDGLALVNEIDKRSEVCEEFNCNNNDFDLKQVISSLGIIYPENIFINWYRYDNIDKMSFSDLAGSFDDIWYADVDDIDIFDKSFKWLLSFTHYGQVKILKF